MSKCLYGLKKDNVISFVGLGVAEITNGKMEEKIMGKAYLYLRISFNSQIGEFGPDRQEKTCREYAKRAGFEIAGVFKDEAISRTTDQETRPAFQEMVRVILENGVRTIIVESLERLAKELKIQETLSIYLSSKGIDLISAQTGENITQAIQRDPLSKALIQIQGAFLKLEKNVRRLRKGRERKKEMTDTCKGRNLYGETLEEQEIIQRIKRWRRGTRGGYRGLTLRAIADKLNEEGIPTKLGRKWSPQQIANILKK